MKKYGKTQTTLAALRARRPFGVQALACLLALFALCDEAFGDGLGQAIGQRQWHAVEALVKANPALANRKDHLEWSLLHIAVGHGLMELSKVLIANKADVNAMDKKDMTPLHFAVQLGPKEMVELLLASQADVNAKNNVGDTPLSLVLAKREEIKKWPQDRSGNKRRTALNLCDERIALLRKHGAKE